MAKGFGFHVELVSSQQARELFPLLESAGVVGAAWIEGDGYVDPTSLTNAYAAGARAGGAKLIQGVTATGIKKRGRRVTTVVTDQGRLAVGATIETEPRFAVQIRDPSNAIPEGLEPRLAATVVTGPGG